MFVIYEVKSSKQVRSKYTGHRAFSFAEQSTIIVHFFQNCQTCFGSRRRSATEILAYKGAEDTTLSVPLIIARIGKRKDQGKRFT